MRSWLVAGLVLFSLTAQAHQDRILTLAPDGRLQGLPTAYEPARLDVGFTAMGSNGTRLTRLSLQLGKHQVSIPTCLLGLIPSDQRGQLQMSASWDHDESVLPYYVHLTLHDPAPSRGSFSLLFDLRTARLMSMEVQVPREGGDQSLPIDVHARCADDELANVLRQPISPTR